MTDKDRLIKELKHFINSDWQWLTRDDQDSIMLKIDELDKFINSKYESHKNIVKNV